MARDEPDEDAIDPTRREFFRHFGRESVRNAGAVVGAAAEIRRAGNVAARDLLDLAGPLPVVPNVEREPVVESGFSSAYRLGEGVLLVLDQRELPGRMSILSLAAPSEVSSAMRSGAINGGPILGEVASYSLALAAGRATNTDLQSLDREVRSAANTLRTPRPEVHALRAAVDRMEAAYEQITADAEVGADASRIAQALRVEADQIASDAQADHSALGRVGAELIGRYSAEAASSTTDALNLLMHGDMGPLSAGMVGTGTAVLNSLASGGRAVHVWVTEAAPSTEGARVAALQLTQMDVPHTVISNSAVAWLLASRHVDAALLRGDTVAANGETLALIGSLNVATLATAADVPVLVIAPGTSFDEQSADGRSLVLDLRSPAESFAASVQTGSPRPAVFGVRLNPTVDIIPRAFVSGYVTESGVRPGGRT